MRVYNSRVRGDTERATMRSVFGMSILLGTTSALMARDAGCAKMELLAVDDGNEYAAKLVSYYSRLGFETVRVVGGNGLRDVPDLLVWGGVGTRMNGDLRRLLGKWGGSSDDKTPPPPPPPNRGRRTRRRTTRLIVTLSHARAI